MAVVVVVVLVVFVVVGLVVVLVVFVVVVVTGEGSKAITGKLVTGHSADCIFIVASAVCGCFS